MPEKRAGQIKEYQITELKSTKKINGFYTDVQQEIKNVEQELAELKKKQSIDGTLHSQCRCGKAHCPDIGKPYHSIRYLFKEKGKRQRHVPQDEVEKLTAAIKNYNRKRVLEAKLEYYRGLLRKGVTVTSAATTKPFSV